MHGLLGSDNIWRDTTIWKSGVWGYKKNIDKITFKVVQIKFLAMHITNQKWEVVIYLQ